MNVFWKRAKMLPMWPSCTQNGFKFTPKSSKMLRKTPKVTPKWPPSVPKVTQSDAKMEPKCPKVHIWSHLGLNFGELGANLGQLRVDLGTTWHQLRPIWPKATPKLTQSVPKSPQSGSKLTPEFHTGQLFDGRVSQKVKLSLTFLATLPSKRCPVCFMEKSGRKVKIWRKFNFLGYSTFKTLSRTKAAARTPKGIIRRALVVHRCLGGVHLRRTKWNEVLPPGPTAGADPIKFDRIVWWNY